MTDISILLSKGTPAILQGLQKTELNKTNVIVIGQYQDGSRVHVEDYNGNKYAVRAININPHTLDNLDHIISNIQLIPITLKKYILDNRLHSIWIEHVPDKEKLFICMLLMTGLFIWNTQGIKFKEWLLDEPEDKIFDTSSDMCCYEAILYAMWLARLTTKECIKTLLVHYTNTPNDTDMLARKIAKDNNLVLGHKNKQKIISYLKYEFIYKAMGCMPQITYDDSQVNIGFNVEVSLAIKNNESNLVDTTAMKSELKKEQVPTFIEDGVVHIYIVYKSNIIHINEPLDSSVTITDIKTFQMINLVPKVSPSTNTMCRFNSFIGDIDQMITTFST
jgi:hypothetical protein